MQRSALKEIIIEQASELAEIDTGISRSIMPDVLEYARLPHAIVVSGVRRSGKSTLLAQVTRREYKGGVYYMDFEDERLIDFTVSDLNPLYEAFLELYGEREAFLFDEIQNIPKWEIFVRRMQSKGHKFYITGSNASMLSRELGTKLTGRHINIELFPFSFPEFLQFKGASIHLDGLRTTAERAEAKKYFAEHMQMGGMPEFLQYQKPSLLKGVYDDIIYRDIVTRYGIKQVKPLRALALYLLSNIGSAFSYNNLKHVLGLGSMNTVKSFVDHLENSYLIFTISKFSYSLKEQLVSNKKAYCVDNGLAEAAAFQFTENKGKFLENLVYMCLRRSGRDIYYYKTSNDLEVDFLVKSGRKGIDLFQVCYDLDREKARDREVSALNKAMDELKIDRATILSYDTEDEIKTGSKIITVKPVYKWLLE